MRTLKKASIAAASIVLLLAVPAAVMIAGNPAPVVPRAAPRTDRPIVVKFHARWRPVCMVTKDMWDEIHATYADRVELVVFDFTSDDTTEAARTEARRLGLERLFDDYYGTTGSVFVLNGHSKAMRTELHGNRKFNEYRTAIDAALRDAQP